MRKTAITRNKHLEFTKSRNGGFTIGELMVTTLLVLLVTSTVAIGVGFANKQYDASKMASESEMLCSTLSSIIRSELSNTKTVKLGEQKSGSVYYLDSFYSQTYSIEEGLTGFYSVKGGRNHDMTQITYGELVLGTEVDTDYGPVLYGNFLLGSASYTEYGLGARVTLITYDDDPDNHVFHVELSVANDKGEELANRKFDVIPLNDIVKATTN